MLLINTFYIVYHYVCTGIYPVRHLPILSVAWVAIASAVSTREVPLSVNGNFKFTGWLAILLLYLLAQVFLDGARRRDELEGTA